MLGCASAHTVPLVVSTETTTAALGGALETKKEQEQKEEEQKEKEQEQQEEQEEQLHEKEEQHEEQEHTEELEEQDQETKKEKQLEKEEETEKEKEEEKEEETEKKEEEAGKPKLKATKEESSTQQQQDMGGAGWQEVSAPAEAISLSVDGGLSRTTSPAARAHIGTGVSTPNIAPVGKRTVLLAFCVVGAGAVALASALVTNSRRGQSSRAPRQPLAESPEHDLDPLTAAL